MPPTDPDRPTRGPFDDEFWDELADYLDVPPRRPEPPAPPEPDTGADSADGAGTSPDAAHATTPPGPAAEPLAASGAAEDRPFPDAASDDDGWWEGVWADGEPAGEDLLEAADGQAAEMDADGRSPVDAASDDEPPVGVGSGAPALDAADAIDPSEEEWPTFAPDEPPVASASRRSRRRMSARTQRRVAAGALVAAVVAVVTLVGPVRTGVADAARTVGNGTAAVSDAVADRWRSWSTELQTIAAGLPERQIDEQRQLEGSESLLFVIEDADRATVGIALLALAPDGGSTLALLPASLYDILPGYGDYPLADATVFEGAELTNVTVANVLGVRIDDTVTLGPGDIAFVLGGGIDVDLVAPLVVDEGGGTERVLAQAGPGERSAELAESLMVVRGTSDRLEWLQRQTAVWQGILAAVASDPGVPTRLAAFASDPEAATGTLARAAAGDPIVTVVPVTRVALSGAEEGFKVSYDDAASFVASRMPHLVLRDGERPRIEVLNGNGRILTTRTVAGALIRRGFRVVKTDNAENFEFATTLVIAQGRDHRADADEVLGVLGTGELLLELRAPSGVVDVSIIVGDDIPAGEE